VTSTASSGIKTTGAVIPISVTFSEPVIVAGTPQLTLETGTTDTTLNYVSGSGTNTLVFSDYTVGSTHTADRLEVLAPAQISGTLDVTGDFIRNVANTLDADVTIDLSIAIGASKLFKINPNLFLSQVSKTASDIMGQYTTTGGFLAKYDGQIVNNNAGAVNPLGFDLGSNNADIIIDTIDHRLFFPDTNNNRVLVYNLDSSNNLLDRYPDNVIGQTDLFRRTPCLVDAVCSGLVAGMAYDAANKRLFVSDSGRHRILVYDVTTITNGESAINVLGQTDFITNTSGLSSTKLNDVRGLEYDAANNRLYAVDFVNKRVLVFDVASITDGEAAVNVLGQPDFTTANTTVSQSGIGTGPTDVELDVANNRLFVAIRGDNRVLVYNVSSITDGEAAVNVLGQALFTTSTAGATQRGMSQPAGIEYDSVNNRLFVAQEAQHRVLVYDTATIVDGEAAIAVIGQANFTTVTASVAQDRLSTPKALGFDTANQRLYVGNLTPNRVTIYDVGTQPYITSITTSATDGHKTTGAVIPITVNFNVPVTVTGTPQLTVETGTVDTVLNYVSGSGSTALVFSDYTVAAADNPTSRFDANSLALAGGTILDASGNAASLTIPTETGLQTRFIKVNPNLGIADGKSAFDVVGQYTTVQGFANNFGGTIIQNNSGAVYDRGLSIGTTTASNIIIDSIDHRLFVADGANNRVLVFNLDTNDNLIDRRADFVLGKPDLFTNTPTTASQSNIGVAAGLAYDTSRKYLFVGDNTNHRVLIFDVTTITNGENAINVIGQSNFTGSASANTQAGMNGVQSLALDEAGSRLFVAQS
jgi:large repetitive protein